MFLSGFTLRNVHTFYPVTIINFLIRRASVVLFPRQRIPNSPTHPDFSKLAVAQFLNQLERLAGNLPHILGLH